MPEEVVRETISITRSSAHVTDEEKEIAGLYNRLVRAGINKALFWLEHGTPEQKMRITTTAIQAASRLAALESASEIEEARLEFERLVSEVTDVGGTSQIVVSGPDAPPPTRKFIDASSTPLAIGPDDQD